MAKAKHITKKDAVTASADTRQGSNKAFANKNTTSKATSRRTSYTVLELRDNRDLWYKTCALIYDLRNMTKDKTCENRTLQTTDALYISTPYFSDGEAAAVKAATMDDGTTVEQAISTSLENFFEKRKASGDCRPCGPHDMVPVYLECFGVDKAEIEDEKFVSRVKRSGLGES